ncbi:MAG TPA: tyrosine-protein phosphatase [Gemmataceae bacterium]
MARRLPYLLGLLAAVGIVAVPLLYSEHREAHRRNFRVVEDGVLYRSGQLSREGLRRVVAEYGIRTVVSLRYPDEPGEPAPDAAEEAECAALGVRHVRVRPRRWWSPDGPPPADETVRQFLEVMDDPSARPVLVHCYAGMHRTGALCAIYRMEYEGWSNEQAMREMRHCGYTNLDAEWDVHDYIRGYRPRRAGHPPSPSLGTGMMGGAAGGNSP